MATKCITYYTNNRLNCPDCFPTDAILCLPSELLVSGKHTIEASLVYSQTQAQICNGPFFQYTFEYDDTLLIEDTVLRSENILGAFCKDCFTTWVEDLLDN